MPRKNFKEENPALNFISAKSDILKKPDKETPPIQEDSLNKIIEAVIKPEAKQEENRSKRFSLAVQPSLYDDLSIAATLYRTNMNDLCHTIFTDYVNGQRDKIEKFRELSKQFLK